MTRDSSLRRGKATAAAAAAAAAAGKGSDQTAVAEHPDSIIRTARVLFLIMSSRSLGEVIPSAKVCVNVLRSSCQDRFFVREA
eukprot:1158583-Pelagomonas_calceolata.AAC.2